MKTNTNHKPKTEGIKMNAAEKKTLANKIAKDNYKLTGLKDRKIWNQCVKDSWTEVNAMGIGAVPKKTEVAPPITGPKQMIITVSLRGFVDNWKTLSTNKSASAAHVWKRMTTAEKYRDKVAARYPDNDVEVQVQAAV
jgi:hypothetical protein